MFVGDVYLVALFAVSRGWTAIPWATLFVNVVGCFFITFVMAIAAAFTMRENLRLFLTTGIMGGLTTYSTFDLEATNFLRAGESSSAFLYIGLTLVLCFCSGLLGLAVARLVA